MRIQLGPLSQFPIDTPTPVQADDHKFIVVRRSEAPDDPCVFTNRCPHLGLSLSRGTYRDGIITCPWHNSEFDACTGENLDWAPGFAGFKAPGWSRKIVAMGRTPAPLAMQTVTVQDGQVVVEV